MLINFLDLETTGKLDPAHRIVEMSMRIVDVATWTERRSILRRFNPQRNIDAKAFAVHGISLDDLADKPTFEVEAPTIAKVLKASNLIIAHNGGGPNYEGGFDYKFLKMELERVGVEMPDTPWFDTMVHGNFATQLGKSPRLEELCFALDVEYDKRLAHKGDYDTEVLSKATKAAIDYGWWTKAQLFNGVAA